jgi:hypothetical protein
MDAVNNIALGRYNLSLSESYFSNYVSTPEFGVKVDTLAFHWDNSFGASLGRNFNRLGFNVGYKRTDLFYDNNNKKQDHALETYNFEQYFKIATKTRLLLEYAHDKTTYRAVSSHTDSSDDSFGLTVIGVLSSKLSALLNTTYKTTDTKSLANNREMTYGTTLGYMVSKRTNLALQFQHKLHIDTNDASNATGDTLNITGNHRLAFNPKMNLSFGYNLDLTDYPKSFLFVHEADKATYTFGLTYAFRQWLDFNLECSHARVSSNSSDSYHNNIFTFSSEARF